MDPASQQPPKNGASKGPVQSVPLEVVDHIPGEIPSPGTGDASGSGSQASKPGFFGENLRFIVTLAVAGLADGLEVLFPFAWVPIDLATVGVFFLLWGLRWEVALVLLPELIPGANIFPSWILLALYLGKQGPNKSA